MVGLGYIGLPTAVVIAETGANVVGYDINPHVVDLINQGIPHIHEPGLINCISEVIEAGNFYATTTPESADVFLIAVPTPFKENHKPDIKFILDACEAIAPCLNSGNMLILESTSPVGTTEVIAAFIAKLRPDLRVPLFSEDPNIYIAYCPERVLPGRALFELVNNDRIIGGIDKQSEDFAIQFYRTFVKANCVATNSKTAEMCKLAENSFRDVNIAFANELSMICEELNINIWELIKLTNLHPRVDILQPGPGVGGHCIAIDPWFIVDKSPNTAKIIRLAREVNIEKENWIVEKIRNRIQLGLIKDILFLGLSFKKNIDDLRESPAVQIVKKISDLTKSTQLSLKVAEPFIKELPFDLKLNKNIKLVIGVDCIKEADLVVLLVDHDVFKNYENLINKDKLIDTRGLFTSCFSSNSI